VSLPSYLLMVTTPQAFHSSSCPSNGRLALALPPALPPSTGDNSRPTPSIRYGISQSPLPPSLPLSPPPSPPSQELRLTTEEIEPLLVDLILDNRIKGQIDQVRREGGRGGMGRVFIPHPLCVYVPARRDEKES